MEQGKTAVHVAVEEARLKILKLLLAYKPNLSQMVYLHNVCVHVRVYTCDTCMCNMHTVINPRRACAARVTFRLSVCLSVTTFSATTRNKAAKKRYQRVQYHTGLIFDFRKSTAFKSYGLKTKRTSQYANKHGLPRPYSARFRARWR